jgi:hypothetical protein
VSEVPKKKDPIAPQPTATVPELEARIAALAGDIAKRDTDLAKERARSVELEAQVAKLRGALRDTDAVSVDGLEDGEAQLRDAVTLPTVAGVTVDAKLGDIVTTRGPDRAKELQTKLGTKTRVHAISEATLRELDGLGLAKH